MIRILTFVGYGFGEADYLNIISILLSQVLNKNKFEVEGSQLSPSKACSKHAESIVMPVHIHCSGTWNKGI